MLLCPIAPRPGLRNQMVAKIRLVKQGDNVSTQLFPRLELEAAGELDSTRRAGRASPGSEVAVRHVVMERNRGAAVVAALRCDQVVVVEGVEEVGRELEVESLDDLEVLCERNIPVLVR